MGQSSVLLRAVASAAGTLADATVRESCLGSVWQQMKAPGSSCSSALRRAGLFSRAVFHQGLEETYSLSRRLSLQCQAGWEELIGTCSAQNYAK